MLVGARRVTGGVVWVVSLERSTLGVVVRGGGGGVVRRRLVPPGWIDPAIVGVLLAWLQCEAVLADVGVVLVLRGRLWWGSVWPVNICWSRRRGRGTRWRPPV